MAVIIEYIRPYRWYRRSSEPIETGDIKKSIAQQIKDDARFMYWENQNPFYVTLLSTLMPLIFIASAMIVWLSEGWTVFASIFGAFMILLGVFMLLFTFGGQRTTISRLELFIRWGAIGLKVLRLNTAEITGTELIEFSPLRDFGGYGIRYGRGMSAYYLRGNRGVKLTMINGKKYVIGSDRPEQLLDWLER